MPDGPAVPEQPASQPTPEVIKTPRQRVEASFREREETAYQLNVVNTPGGSKWGWEWTPERYAEEKRLEDQLGEQNRKFREEIVNSEPEAQAWVEIEGEKYRHEVGARTEQAMYGVTPTDKEYGKLMMRFAQQNYDKAVENLKQVHEKTAGATTPKITS